MAIFACFLGLSTAYRETAYRMSVFWHGFCCGRFSALLSAKKGNATKALHIMNIAIYQYVQAVYQSLNSEVRAREMMIFSGVETVRVTCSLLSGHMEISLTAR